jgi:hypothetical protein
MVMIPMIPRKHNDRSFERKSLFLTFLSMNLWIFCPSSPLHEVICNRLRGMEIDVGDQPC